MSRVGAVRQTQKCAYDRRRSCRMWLRVSHLRPVRRGRGMGFALDWNLVRFGIAFVTPADRLITPNANESAKPRGMQEKVAILATLAPLTRHSDPARGTWPRLLAVFWVPCSWLCVGMGSAEGTPTPRRGHGTEARADSSRPGPVLFSPPGRHLARPVCLPAHGLWFIVIAAKVCVWRRLSPLRNRIGG